MDPHAFDPLQQRLANLERRVAQLLRLVFVAFLVIITALAVNFVGRNASAQPAFEQFAGAYVHFFHDPSTGATCYLQGTYGISCVK